MAYKKIDPAKAYRLLNSGSLLLICTKNKKGEDNMAPVAWTCPVEYDPTTEIVIVCDRNHQTYRNIVSLKHFVACIPHASQKDIVVKTGSVSGEKINKIEQFNIKTILSPSLKIKVPVGCIGFIECRLIKTIRHRNSAILIGQAIGAMAGRNAFTDRLLSEKKEGRTLHHLGANIFITTGRLIK